jgi:PAS domain S-box-containing protein
MQSKSIEYKEYLKEKEARIKAERELKVAKLKLDEITFANSLHSLSDNLTPEVLFRQDIAGASDIIYKTDLNGRFTYVNQAGVEITGFETENLIGLHFTQLVVQSSRREIKTFYKLQCEKKEYTTYYEFQIKSKNGDLVWLGQNVQLITSENQVIGFLAIARDITKRIESNLKLKESEQKYRGLFTKMKEGLLFSRPDGTIEIVNPSFCKMLGYANKELIGEIGYKKLHKPEVASNLMTKTSKRLEGESSDYETEFLHKSGRSVWTQISAHPHYDL